MSVIVCGYDKYAKLWSTFKHGFDKYWPDCPWERYFITNFMNGPRGFKTIKTLVETSWSNKAIRALMQIKTDIIFWMMEDCWHPGPVDTETMVKFYDLMMKNPNIDHIRFVPPFLSDGTIHPEHECSGPTPYDSRLWYFKQSAEWRASIMAPFWRRTSLLNYLKEGRSVWQFEDEAGSLSTKSQKEHLCAVDPRIFPFPHKTNPYQTVKDEIVMKGAWTSAAIDYCKTEGIKMDFSIHPNGVKNVMQ